jgi:hypothetical protein
MTTILNLPPDVKNFIEASLTDMLDPSIFGELCILHLPAIQTDCPNCLPDSIGQKSSGIYLSGGPQPFANGQICPVCFGTYAITTPNDINIYGSLEFKFDNFIDILKRNVRYPESTIQIRTYSSYINNLLNTSSLETRLDIPNVHYKYKLLGEPVVPGKFSNKFCYSIWERI